MKTITSRLLDGSAVGLSGLCLVHCLALPVLAVLLPVLDGWARAEWVHGVFVTLAAPISGFALLRPVHGRKAPRRLVGIALLGLGLLALGAFGPAPLETPITVAGSLTLAGAHLWNWRRHATAHCEA